MKLSSVPKGTRVRVTVEGVVNVARAVSSRENRVFIRLDSGRNLSMHEITADEIDAERAIPKWEEGDVIRYAGATFVRAGLIWLGSNGWESTDSEINARFEIGQVTHLLRDGRPVS